MSVIRLTESDLRRVVRNVLSESVLLSEGYSAKHFESQVREIADDFWKFKDTQPGEDVVQSKYPITISLKPFFNNGEVSEKYLQDKTYQIRLFFDKRLNASNVDGSFKPDFMGYDGLSQISIKIFLNTPYESLYSALLHEVTHLVDYLIKQCRNTNTHTYPINKMLSMRIPRNIAFILYALWGHTEFNAWQSSYKVGSNNDDDYFNALMGALKMANDNYGEREWSMVRNYVAEVTSNQSLMNKSPMEFKNYFIKTSFNLLKKMVRKYY